MDLAPSVGVFTRHVTTSINRFSAVNATKTRILNKGRTEMVEEQFVFMLRDSWRVEKGVVVIYFSPIHLSLSPPFLSLIPRAIPPGSCPPISPDPFV